MAENDLRARTAPDTGTSGLDIEVGPGPNDLGRSGDPVDKEMLPEEAQRANYYVFGDDGNPIQKDALPEYAERKLAYPHIHAEL